MTLTTHRRTYSTYSSHLSFHSPHTPTWAPKNQRCKHFHTPHNKAFTVDRSCSVLATSQQPSKLSTTAPNPPLESGHAQRVPSLSQPSNRVTLPQKFLSDREYCRNVWRRCTGSTWWSSGPGQANVLRPHHIEGDFVRYRGFGPGRWTPHGGTIVPYVYAMSPFTLQKRLERYILQTSGPAQDSCFESTTFLVQFSSI